MLSILKLPVEGHCDMGVYVPSRFADYLPLGNHCQSHKGERTYCTGSATSPAGRMRSRVMRFFSRFITMKRLP